MAFTFMISMIKKDMHHMLVDAMKREDQIGRASCRERVLASV